MLYSEEQITRNWGANLNRFYVHKAGKNVTFHTTKKTSAIFKKQEDLKFKTLMYLTYLVQFPDTDMQHVQNIKISHFYWKRIETIFKE